MKYLAYWCGPYTGDVAINVQRAQRWAAEVNRTGLVWAVLPHVCSNGIESSLSAEEWTAMTLALSKRCDGLLMDPRWEDSPGSVGEHNAAIAEGRPVAYCRSLAAILLPVRDLVAEIEHIEAMKRAAMVSLPKEVV